MLESLGAVVFGQEPFVLLAFFAVLSAHGVQLAAFFLVLPNIHCRAAAPVECIPAVLPAISRCWVR
ncbi:hypothetical protein GQ54DRAFT_298442 [Martensiomyces pterosporus]|nr:hypothetical protein GQ54DRAFT_298442 [Martensiomyces pterosporus]